MDDLERRAARLADARDLLVLRPRRLQELQRHLRPPRRRRAARRAWATRSSAASAPRGVAYRLGGDEFCVLPPPARARSARARGRPPRCPSRARASRSGLLRRASRIPDEAPRRHQALRDRRPADVRRKELRPRHRPAARAPTCCCACSPSATPSLGSTSAASPRSPRPSAARLGLDGEELDDVRRAAELHDIGKVAIPDAILNKPGPLDDEEWAFMRRHTIIGERILAAAPALGAGRPLVRSSHERFDGSGYPDGLAGRGDPARRADRRRLRRLRRHDLRPRLPRRRRPPPRRSPSCTAAPARSSTRRSSRPSPPCSERRQAPARPSPLRPRATR